MMFWLTNAATAYQCVLIQLGITFQVTVCTVLSGSYGFSTFQGVFQMADQIFEKYKSFRLVRYITPSAHPLQSSEGTEKTTVGRLCLRRHLVTSTRCQILLQTLQRGRAGTQLEKIVQTIEQS